MKVGRLTDGHPVSAMYIAGLFPIGSLDISSPEKVDCPICHSVNTLMCETSTRAQPSSITQNKQEVNLPTNIRKINTSILKTLPHQQFLQ
jgi:hypothetical protein